jgi:hypothetical protein
MQTTKFATLQTAERRLKRQVLARIEETTSFENIIGDGEIELDALAKALAQADIEAGANLK